MASVNVTIEVRIGPVLKAAIELLETVSELQDIIPEWHAAERDDLMQKSRDLHAAILRGMPPDCGTPGSLR